MNVESAARFLFPFFFLLFFETGSFCYVVLAVAALYSQRSTYLSFQSAGINGVCHYAWLLASLTCAPTVLRRHSIAVSVISCIPTMLSGKCCGQWTKNLMYRHIWKEALLGSEFQDSQGCYTVKPSLKTKNKTKTKTSRFSKLALVSGNSILELERTLIINQNSALSLTQDRRCPWWDIGQPCLR